MPITQLSKNFTRSEFACKCGCGFANPHPTLVKGLQLVRCLVGKPIIIISGCRCKTHNEAEHGAKGSMHLPDDEGFGRAADITCPTLPIRKLYEVAASTLCFNGIGVDDARNMLHLDIRPKFTRWCYADGTQTKWYNV